MTSGSSGGFAGDRLAGVTTLVVALAAAIEGLTFDTTFPTDPLGPKAFPLVAAVLLGLGGLRVALSPSGDRTEKVAGAVWLAAASFVAYALVLEPLGFLLATTLEFAVLGRLFGGRPVRAAASGAAFALLLYLVFVTGLGLGLPPGTVFVVGR